MQAYNPHAMTTPTAPPLQGAPNTWMRNGLSPSCVALPSRGHGSGNALLLDYLAERLPIVDRATWHARMAAGDVVNAQGQPVLPTQLLQPLAHGLAHVYYWRALVDEVPIPFEAQVLFEDEHLLLVDKPHFLPVLPSGKYLQNSLLVRLKRATGNADLSPLHRIDRDTAGLVLLSKNASTRGLYQALFRDRVMHKTYEAVAPLRAGLSFPRSHRSRLQESDNFFLMHEVPGEPNSHTELSITEANDHWARYALQPISGKRHQLRVHMAALGIPIRNDAFYPEVNDPPEGDYSRPLQLLAQSLAFTDPISGEARQWHSSLQLLALPVGAIE